jgi:predicted RNase H-like nuclease (RuvC/YqgF family)
VYTNFLFIDVDLFKALQAEKEALLNKNRELLSELRTAKNKNKEIDPENYSKVLDENDVLKSELNKIKNDLGLKTKDIEQLTGKLTEKENYLKNLTLENSLNEQLTKVNVKPELLPAVKALLKGQASVNENNVLIGDKAINDFMAEWSATDGKAYIQAPADQWFTIEQVEHAKAEAFAIVQGKVHNALKSGAQKFNRKQSKNSFISISMEVKGGFHRTYTIPAQAAELMQLEIQCEKCNARFAIIVS